MVAWHVSRMRRVSPDGRRTWAYLPSFAINCAPTPAERTNCPPLPRCSSTLWMVVPTGMARSGRLLPGRMSAVSLAMIESPSFKPMGVRIYRFSPSSYSTSEIRQERLGSYSMVRTFAGTSFLFRLKSMMRYIRLWPPPWKRWVTRPLLLRPPVFLIGSRRGLCGSTGWFLPGFLVSSSKVETDRKRRAGPVGLYCRIGIELDLLEQDERHIGGNDGLLPVGRIAGFGVAAHGAFLFPLHVDGIDRQHSHAVFGIDGLNGLGDFDLVGVQAHTEMVFVHRSLIRALFRQQGPLDDVVRVSHAVTSSVVVSAGVLGDQTASILAMASFTSTILCAVITSRTEKFGAKRSSTPPDFRLLVDLVSA